MANSTETRSQITIPPLALPKSGTVEDLSSSQPVTQAPAGSFLFCFSIEHTPIPLSNLHCLLLFALPPETLLFTPFSATRFAMHRIYANRINSRGMSRVFCDLRSQKTPRGILPVNSNPETFLIQLNNYFGIKNSLLHYFS